MSKKEHLKELLKQLKEKGMRDLKITYTDNTTQDQKIDGVINFLEAYLKGKYKSKPMFNDKFMPE